MEVVQSGAKNVEFAVMRRGERLKVSKPVCGAIVFSIQNYTKFYDAIMGKMARPLHSNKQYNIHSLMVIIQSVQNYKNLHLGPEKFLLL